MCNRICTVYILDIISVVCTEYLLGTYLVLIEFLCGTLLGLYLALKRYTTDIYLVYSKYFLDIELVLMYTVRTEYILGTCIALIEYLHGTYRVLYLYLVFSKPMILI